jgi:hypothetical protein
MSQISDSEPCCKLTNGQTIEWYKRKIKDGKLPQDLMKKEAIIFFGTQFQHKDKKTIWNKLLCFNSEHTILRQKI